MGRWHLLPAHRANTIGVDSRVTPLDPPGDAEVDATEQRVPPIAFPKSDRVDASGAGDAYGDEGVANASTGGRVLGAGCKRRHRPRMHE